MYRPNRIGPHPLIDIDQAGNPPTLALTNLSTTEIFPKLGVMANNFTAKEETDHSDWIILDRTITPNSDWRSISIGVVLNGLNIKGGNKFHCSVSGKIWARLNSIVPVHLFAFIGRVEGGVMPTDPLTEVIPVSNYTLLPSIVTGAETNTNIAISSSINTQFVYGNFSGNTPELDSAPIICGWALAYKDNSTPQIDLMCSIAAHRYTKDIITIDPGRG